MNHYRIDSSAVILSPSRPSCELCHRTVPITMPACSIVGLHGRVKTTKCKAETEKKGNASSSEESVKVFVGTMELMVKAKKFAVTRILIRHFIPNSSHCPYVTYPSLTSHHAASALSSRPRGCLSSPKRQPVHPQHRSCRRDQALHHHHLQRRH